MRKYKIISEATRPVLPTPTDLIRVNVFGFVRMSMEVTNLDGSQTLDVYVYRRLSNNGGWGQLVYPELLAIAPGATVPIDIDVSSTFEVELRGTASGGGLDCRTAGMVVE